MTTTTTPPWAHGLEQQHSFCSQYFLHSHCIAQAPNSRKQRIQQARERGGQHLGALLILTERIQESGVVGNDDDTAAKGDDLIAERIDGLHVQMVGRLVEQEDVRLGEGDRHVHHPRLLPARQFDDRLRTT